MDQQRALLDQLMGLNRDGDRPEDEVTDFRDSRVCKKYLAGLCIHDLFLNTKMDMGECSKAHIPELKKQYEASSGFSSDKLRYKADLESELLKLHIDVTKRAEGASKRLEQEQGTNNNNSSSTSSSNGKQSITENAQVLTLISKMQDIIENVQIKGLEGNVDEAVRLLSSMEELKRERASAQANAMLTKDPSAFLSIDTQSSSTTNNPRNLPDVNQKLRVCNICASFLSIFDSDRRLADHFGGKLHLGYLQIKKKIQELRALRGADCPEVIPKDYRRGSCGGNDGDYHHSNKRHRSSNYYSGTHSGTGGDRYRRNNTDDKRDNSSGRSNYRRGSEGGDSSSYSSRHPSSRRHHRSSRY